MNQLRKLRAEGEDGRQHCCHADNRRVVDAGQRQHASVLAVSGVRRSAEERRHRRRQTVAQQRTVQTRIFDEVLADRRGDGGHIANVLHHRRQRNRGNGDDAVQQQRAVTAAKEGERGILPLEGQTQPSRFLNGGEVHLTRHRRDSVRTDHAQQNRDNLEHALAPDVERHHDDHRQNRDEPVIGAVVDGGVRQNHADADDDRAGDNRREEAHDLLRAEDLEQTRDNDVNQTRDRHAHASVGNPVHRAVRELRHCLHRRIAAEEREARTEERRDFAARDEVEQQRAQTRKEQGCADRQTCQGRHKHGCAEHGEHVLETQQSELRRGKFLIGHVIPSFLHICCCQPLSNEGDYCKSACAEYNQIIGYPRSPNKHAEAVCKCDQLNRENGSPEGRRPFGRGKGQRPLGHLFIRPS